MQPQYIQVPLTPEIPYGYCHCGCGQKTLLAKTTDKRAGTHIGEPISYVNGHATRVRGEGPNPGGLCMCGCGEKTNLAAVTKRANGWVKGQPIRYIDGHGRRKRQTLADVFWRYCSAGEADACWEWQGSTSKNGYGRLSWANHGHQAHRASWEIHNARPIPDDLWVCHSCDNRLCVNPAHLWLGTRQDNIDDMVTKGRQASGARASHAKLTDDDVRLIRKLAAEGVTYKSLADHYGVMPSIISQAARGIFWRHLTGDWVDLRRPAKSLTVNQVHKIRALAAQGLNASEIAKQIDKPHAIIWFVLQGRSYTDV